MCVTCFDRREQKREMLRSTFAKWHTVEASFATFITHTVYILSLTLSQFHYTFSTAVIHLNVSTLGSTIPPLSSDPPR